MQRPSQADIDYVNSLFAAIRGTVKVEPREPGPPSEGLKQWLIDHEEVMRLLKASRRP
jgi:hypothetical protein